MKTQQVQETKRGREEQAAQEQLRAKREIDAVG